MDYQKTINVCEHMQSKVTIFTDDKYNSNTKNV